ncbi:uncharacterized protein LOC120170208 [Hibiscus syriacus]|uniref:uncharacterized protein LOC120170208 n=1 Tax=Hibiscus syriacus TaxID=106335 RepID=UPI001921953F|nr:uncharacterized protein LOC120170208 [Hibiscus syriacus]
MDWLNKNRVNLDCETKRAILKTPDKRKIMMIGEHCVFLMNVVYALVAERMIRKGCKVIQPYLDQFMVVFNDDILVYSQTEVEYDENLKIVLQTLRENKLYTKLSK